MPETPATLDGTNRIEGWFMDAPGGDQSLDELFPVEGSQPTTATSTQPETPPQPTEEFFLKTSTGTVYKTQDEAAKGVEHKDTLIKELRQYAVEKTGFDPVTKESVKKPEPTKSQSADQPVSYFQNPKKYWEDLVEAAKRGDADAYLQVQAQLVQEQLAPYAPLITSVARQNAVELVGAELKGFREFYGSETYRNTLAAFPELQQGIAVAESNPAFHTQLSGLYKLAFLAAQGMKLPELLRAQSASLQQNPPQPQRPTSTQSTLPPPPSVGATVPQANPYGTQEQRREYIKQMEQRGVRDVTF